MVDWLTARPIAHRGLHDAAQGIIENTATAITAAISADYGIEVDLQVTANGEAVVHHDDRLERLTEGSGRIDQYTSAELKRVPFKNTSDRMLTLAELCELVGGRAVLLVEMKSRFDGDRRLARHVADILSGYSGPRAAMSFDAAQIGMLREYAPSLRRGAVAERHVRRTGDHAEISGGWNLTSLFRARPQFVAYALRDFPAAAPLLAGMLRLPVLTWTVRSKEDQRRARRWADQIIFEGFLP
jgi:glycerophosphoryl diester phosphodiesterase